MKNKIINFYYLYPYPYSSANLYFVTSCVHNRVCCFGEIVVGTGRDLSAHLHGNVRFMNI